MPSASVRHSAGILDGSSSQQKTASGVFTHNPYWYEGFSLSPASTVSAARVASLYQIHPAYDRWAGYNRWEPPAGLCRRLRPMRVTPMTTLKQHVEYENRWKPPSPQTDNSSDHTLGYSDSDNDRDRSDNNLEQQLVQRIIEYFGDCKGSLPSERVQNVIKKDYADLYEAVVVARFRKKWHKFLLHCADTFQLFTRPAQPAPNQDYCWRIRLINNPDWEEADQQDEEYRSQRDHELLDKVRALLENSPGKQCLMIDVINELNKDPKADENRDDGEVAVGDAAGRKARKIRAGDLKRLMRKCNSNFTIVELQDGDNQKRSTYMKLVEP